MLFSSNEFLFFFLPSVLLIYYIFLRKKRKLQNIFLFLVSILFYAWGEPKFVIVMLVSIGVNYIFGLGVDHYRFSNIKKKVILTFSILFNAIILFIFKYLSFTLENINQLFNSDFIIPKITLPIGISFFTFQAISYVVDVYRNNGKVQKNPLNVGLYIAFFPQLIAGPIVRYETIAEQIQNRKENLDDFVEGIKSFIIGLGKKVIFSNSFAIIADYAFDNVGKTSILMAILGIVGYTMQIYFDFSGYSDMAIGLGKMFGFHFEKNFNYPYIARSITDFWRRWHISLSTWFRDYVYIPLGGNRVGKKRLLLNLLVVWAFTGIWHGANWTFLVWGLSFYCLLIIEKMTPLKRFLDKHLIISYIYTLFFVMINWVFFRSNSMSEAGFYLKSMFGFSNVPFIDSSFLLFFRNYFLFLILGIIGCTPFYEWFKEHCKPKVYSIIEVIFLVLVFLVSISYIVKGSYNPFIYFNF